MIGALLKTHYAKAHGIDPNSIKVVSIMPCTAKKTEIERPQLAYDDRPDIDVVLTTREFAQMIKGAGINYAGLEDDDFDAYYGEGSGAGVIFGATGGVMEAALRTAVEVLTGEIAAKVDYPEARGTAGVKEFEVTAAGITLKACVVSGGANIRKIMAKVASGEADYHFIEIMACPGGCVNGGGQPIVSSSVKAVTDFRSKRASVLYDRDANKLPIRKSHENSGVKRLYDEFLSEPNSHKAHELLHTTYSAQPKYK
jgi:NADP-reducing hydrogenase subunit HndD